MGDTTHAHVTQSGPRATPECSTCCRYIDCRVEQRRHHARLVLNLADGVRSACHAQASMHACHAQASLSALTQDSGPERGPIRCACMPRASQCPHSGACAACRAQHVVHSMQPRMHSTQAFLNALTQEPGARDAPFAARAYHASALTLEPVQHAVRSSMSCTA